MPAKLRVTLVKSPIGHTARTRGTLRALGLRRIGQTVEVTDNDQMRGLARTVRFLLRTEETATTEQPATERRSRAKAGKPASGRAAATEQATTASSEAEPTAPARTAPSAEKAVVEKAAPPARPKRAPRAKKETDE